LAAHSDVQHFGYSNGGAFGSSSTNYYGGLMDDLVHYPSVLSLLNKIVLGCDNDNDGIPNYLDLDSDNVLTLMKRMAQWLIPMETELTVE
jgi:hypothetical protein